jgi:hypothetical protein
VGGILTPTQSIFVLGARQEFEYLIFEWLRTEIGISRRNRTLGSGQRGAQRLPAATRDFARKGYNTCPQKASGTCASGTPNRCGRLASGM